MTRFVQRHELVLGCAALLVMVGLWLTTPTTTYLDGADWDGRFYVAMAEGGSGDPLFQAKAPWCWRILTPALVALLPLPTIDAFRILNFGSYLVILPFAISIARRLQIDAPGLALILGLYLTLYWTVRSSFFSPAYIDAQAQLFIWFVLWGTYARRYHLLPFIIGLGTLQKESALLLAFPAWVKRLREEQSAKAKVSLLLFLSLGTIAYIVVRVSIPSSNSYPIEALARKILVEQILEPAQWGALLLELLSGTGILFFLLALFPRRAWQVARTYPELLILIAIGLGSLLFGFDKARLTLTMVPALVLWVGLLFSALRGIRGWFAVTTIVFTNAFFQLTFLPLESHEQMVAYFLPLTAAAGGAPLAYGACLALAGCLVARCIACPLVEPEDRK